MSFVQNFLPTQHDTEAPREQWNLFSHLFLGSFCVFCLEFPTHPTWHRGPQRLAGNRLLDYSLHAPSSICAETTTFIFHFMHLAENIRMKCESKIFSHTFVGLIQIFPSKTFSQKNVHQQSFTKKNPKKIQKWNFPPKDFTKMFFQTISNKNLLKIFQNKFPLTCFQFHISQGKGSKQQICKSLGLLI